MKREKSERRRALATGDPFDFDLLKNLPFDHLLGQFVKFILPFSLFAPLSIYHQTKRSQIIIINYYCYYYYFFNFSSSLCVSDYRHNHKLKPYFSLSLLHHSLSSQVLLLLHSHSQTLITL